MRRGRLLLIVGLALLLAAVGWWVVTVTLMAPTDRANASSHGQFVLAVAGLVLAALPYVLPRLRDHDAADLDELSDQLATAVRAQWMAAAGQRGLLAPEPLPIRWRQCAEPVTGPTTAATTSRSLAGSFPPLPGQAHVTSAQLREGTHRMLYRIYGGLASGRLLLVGGPGTGKSSAAILLLLEALNVRQQAPPEDRSRIPVPVLFTLADWDPGTTPVGQWLAAKLTELPVLTGRRGHADAARLLAANRVAVFLDGLDEIPAHLRVTALRALARHATFRLVLLTRTVELVAAAQHQILTGAVALELQPLTARDAATYLHNGLPDPAPTAWRELLDTVTTAPTAPITQALDNPLTITLLRDVYQPAGATGLVDELLDETRFPTSGHIVDHLLDQAVATAYTPHPGQPPPPYTPQEARRVLAFIAERLRDRNTRDLAWWHIPSWLPPTPGKLVNVGITAVAVGCAVGFLAGALFELVGSLAGGLIGGLAACFMAGAMMRMNSSDSSQPKQVARPRPGTRHWRNTLAAGVVVGFLSGIIGGLVFGIVGGLIGAVVFALSIESTTDNYASVAHPRNLWQGNLAAALSVVLGFVLLSGFMLVLIGGVVLGSIRAYTYILVLGSVFGIVTATVVTDAWYTAISQVYLAVRHRLPLRLGRFLMDANARHILRTVGPVYQFRHALLQDRLAPPDKVTARPARSAAAVSEPPLDGQS